MLSGPTCESGVFEIQLAKPALKLKLENDLTLAQENPEKAADTAEEYLQQTRAQGSYRHLTKEIRLRAGRPGPGRDLW